ncbi:hypothetical protein BC941DRAFT_456790 [Chlamydoabsidia padenii]|nr:hypothetical protein BC941DRAFT_456790 [Chlamydoabsidia padenii]
MTNTSSTDHLSLQQRNFISHFAYTHGKLMQYIGCDPQQGSFYRHVLEFQRPNFKLLLMLYPFHQLTLTQPPLSRTSRLHWYPSKGLEHLSFLSSQHVTRPTTLWRQPQSVHYAQTSRLPRGLYLALFYCQSSPPNNQRGLQIFLEKHHEHRLPCVPLRLDTRITNVEWEWLQTLAQPGYDDDDDEKGQHGIKTPTMGFSETYDFLTKEMQQKQQEHQLAIQQQLAPFQQALRQGRNQLQAMAGVPIQLKDLFSEDSLCMMYDDDVDETKVPDDTTKTLKKKTLSITDMFTYGQLQTQHGWNRPVHVRMLVIVKPLCITPDFPVQPNFDFYPYHVFRTLHQDKMYFSAASLDSPRRQPQHHVSMSDLLNNTTTDITKRPTKRRSYTLL